MLGHAHGHALPSRGGEVLADEIGPDGQLAVPAIDHDGELDGLRPSEVDQGVEGRAHRPTREEHVVDEHHRLALDGERDVGGLDDGPAQVQVVPIERDVERTHGHAGPIDGRDLRGQPPRQSDAARAQAHERHVGRAAVALQDLVGDAGEGAIEGGSVEDFRLLAELRRRAAGTHRLSLRASQGPLKGKDVSNSDHSTRGGLPLSTPCRSCVAGCRARPGRSAGRARCRPLTWGRRSSRPACRRARRTRPSPGRLP
jgi:hypothetical protein